MGTWCLFRCNNLTTINCHYNFYKTDLIMSVLSFSSFGLGFPCSIDKNHPTRGKKIKHSGTFQNILRHSTTFWNILEHSKRTTLRLILGLLLLSHSFLNI